MARLALAAGAASAAFATGAAAGTGAFAVLADRRGLVALTGAGSGSAFANTGAALADRFATAALFGAATGAVGSTAFTLGAFTSGAATAFDLPRLLGAGVGSGSGAGAGVGRRGRCSFLGSDSSLRRRSRCSRRRRRRCRFSRFCTGLRGLCCDSLLRRSFDRTGRRATLCSARLLRRRFRSRRLRRRNRRRCGSSRFGDRLLCGLRRSGTVACRFRRRAYGHCLRPTFDWSFLSHSLDSLYVVPDVPKEVARNRSCSEV